MSGCVLYRYQYHEGLGEKRAYESLATWGKDPTRSILVFYPKNLTLNEVSEKFHAMVDPIIADQQAHEWHESGAYIKPKGNKSDED